MKGGNGSHWEDCWKSHIDCAEAKIASLSAALAIAEEALRAAYKFHVELGAEYKHLVNHVVLDALHESLLSIEKARGKV